MGYYVINGGNALNGRVKVQGSKNSAVAVLIASLITEKTVKISNLPDISDVSDCKKILTLLGCKIENVGEGSIIINTENARPSPLPSELLCRMRASSYLIGAMLSRFGCCEQMSSGGCNFGKRPLNYHIKAMETLGALCEYTENAVTLTAKDGLKGGIISFPQKSVGATVNSVIAAVKANGVTVIKNAAREPHVCDLCAFFNLSGAKIYGAGTDEITVIGQKTLKNVDFSVSPDMIEAGTYLLAGLVTDGRVECVGAVPEHLKSLISVLNEMGAITKISADTVCAYAEKLYPTSVITAPHPGFPTDLHPQLSVLMSRAKGESKICEAIFNSRFQYVEPLKQLGMKCEINGSELRVFGGARLKGASVKATDLRGGAALILAALSANGRTVIENTHFISRGYSDTVKKLKSLGADISFCE